MSVHRASGFALKDNTFHLLRIHLVSVDPQMRYYIKEQKVKEQKGEPIYRGYLRFGENDYKLTSIIAMQENGKTRNYTADIITHSDSVRIGNMSVIMRNYDGVRIGEGSLTMKDSNGSFVYRVLLNIDDG